MSSRASFVILPNPRMLPALVWETSSHTEGLHSLVPSPASWLPGPVPAPVEPVPASSATHSPALRPGREVGEQEAQSSISRQTYTEQRFYFPLWPHGGAVDRSVSRGRGKRGSAEGRSLEHLACMQKVPSSILSISRQGWEPKGCH